MRLGTERQQLTRGDPAPLWSFARWHHNCSVSKPVVGDRQLGRWATPLREWSGEVSCDSTIDDEGRRCAGEQLRGEEDLRHASLQDFREDD